MPAIALSTWGFANLTDAWGEIPYFNALKGDSVGSSLSPTYDKQDAIYADFFTLLDKAAKDLSSASNVLGSNDPIYGGSPAKWQKFINSLRARLALRLVNVNPSLASAQVRDATLPVSVVAGAPAFGLAVILIFLVLAAQFNSFRDPFVILAGGKKRVPSPAGFPYNA